MYTHYLFLPWVPRAEGGSEGGGAGLAVPRHAAGLRGAADGQGVNAVGVAITVAAVLLPATVPRGPHEDGAQSTASLWWATQKVFRPFNTLLRCRKHVHVNTCKYEQIKSLIFHLQ